MPDSRHHQQHVGALRGQGACHLGDVDGGALGSSP